jgi:hypothetical protein
MFDLRYHVVSLVAVFIALIVGIIVGVGMSDRGLLRAGERRVLEGEIRSLQRELDAAKTRQARDADEQDAAETLLGQFYPRLVDGRLRGRRVALVFVGSVDDAVSRALRQGLSDAGAPGPLRMRALTVPIDLRLAYRTLARARLTDFVGRERLRELGAELAREFVAGRETPLWEALTPQLVAERSGSAAPAVDGVVVARTAEPQRDGTARLLGGFYAGLAGAGVPVVGVETAELEPSTLEVFTSAGLSTVDSVETTTGRLALVLLLAGGTPGSYGLGAQAPDGPIPPLDSVPEPPPRG